MYKEIVFDRNTRDYRAELDGQVIGFYANHHAAETALDRTVFELLSDGHLATAEELDGGAVEMPRYTRAAGYDKRIGHGDDYAGDCWKDQDGIPRWVAVGRDPNDDVLANAPMLMPEGDWIDVEGMRIEAPSRMVVVQIATDPRCATCGDDGDCPDCDDEPRYCLTDPTGETPILDDVARVIDMALGSTHGAASVVAELRRIRARIEQVQDCAVTQG